MRVAAAGGLLLCCAGGASAQFLRGGFSGAFGGGGAAADDDALPAGWCAVASPVSVRRVPDAPLRAAQVQEHGAGQAVRG
jgi:hypothetical protein